MTESSQTPPAPSKSKAFLDYFRSRDAPPVTDDAKGTTDPAPNGAAEPATVDLTEKPTAPAAKDQNKSGLSTTELEHQWDEAVAGVKSKANILGKLKRLGSKEAKSAKAKGKEKEKAAEEPAIEDLAALIPLPADGTSTPPISSTTPVATPPATGDNIPGSNTLSKRIQVMLSSVPPFLHTVPDSAQPAPSPVPPLPDAKLLGYLSSPDIMNGNQVTPSSAGKSRKSVWQVLDQLVPYKPPVVQAPGSKPDGEDPEEEASETSLMICAPLIPDADSKVELAKSTVVTVPETDGDDQALASKVIAKGVAASLWPDKLKLPWWKKKKQKPCDDPAPAPPQPPPTKPTKEVKIWIPSKTAISFQVAWWGYRLWLPPPVMHILDDKTLEASKRAAMIATALGWLINNIPVTSLPPPLIPAVVLLKAVVPITGYIGGFIAWSWSQVKSFDKGSGVVLSATWLLPIALIPGSWESHPFTPLPSPSPETIPMTESLQENSQPPPKSKSFLDYFRSKDPVPATDDASGATSVPASSAAAEPPTADLRQQQTPPAGKDQTRSRLSAAQIEKQWDETIARAKADNSIFSKLRRFGSKDGKSDKEKGKEKEKEASRGEPAVEDLAAMVPLPPDDGTATPLISTPTPAATPPANSDAVPESNTLSKRIQVILSSIPPFLHTAPDAAQAAPSPVPPVGDSKLLGYLSSSEVMNGAPATPSSTGKQRRSVWQVLDEMIPYKRPIVPAPGSTTDGKEDPEEEASETSLMICAPLIPDANSKVELAESTIVDVPEKDGEDQSLISKVVAKGVAVSLWPEKVKLPWSRKKQKPSDDTVEAPPPTPPQTKPAKEVKVWIPSKTEISFQVAWWGYRLWLPPPVMHALDDKTLEASKRAAMIAAALGWLIKNIPTTILPPPLRAAGTVLKAFVPYLGYIGGFIAWSWSEIRTFDKGNGVVLSATWLLPIAPIPGSWEDREESISIGKGEARPPTPDLDAPKDGTTTPSNPNSRTGGAATPQPGPSTI
ncbi:hypothetical protein FS837_010687 [Tulasnella sp. UAMH 9824]|nr:hypothetical protein FS837_010687 [Tulasnella sp. UAMH 9824]